MKKINKSIIGLFALILMVSCNDGIDPISYVDPGPDLQDPIVEILSPNNDIIIPFTDTESSIDIEFNVSDDIEIASIVIKLNGIMIATFNSFVDYRSYNDIYQTDLLQLGDHTVEITATDLAGKVTTQSITFNLDNTYTPQIDGEVFYMPFFNGAFTEIININEADVFGNPSFASGKSGQAYKGASNSYLTFDASHLELGGEFSATMWYKLNAAPDRASILVLGPQDLANPDSQNNRTKGFRFFREGSATSQNFILNVGNGTSDSWFNGEGMAGITPSDEWMHIAFTISNTECVVYFNGEVVRQADFTGIDWTDCTILSIMSGNPRFTGWGHLSDESLLDELRIYNRALTQSEIQSLQ